MKKHFMRWLSPLLLAALLLSGTALMEEAPAIEEVPLMEEAPAIEEAPVAEDISVTEEAPSIEDDIEIAAEPEDIEVEETEAVLEEESEEVADVPGEEVVEETSELQYALEEADASEKLMEGSTDALDPNEYIPLTAANFPDATFRNLLSKYAFCKSWDGVTYVVRSTTTKLMLPENVSDLKGIERLTNLQSLKITTKFDSPTVVSFMGSMLDLSTLTKLQNLEIYNAPNLTTLILNSNELTNVELGKWGESKLNRMPKLTQLSLGKSDKEIGFQFAGLSSLTALDLSGFPNMKVLSMSSCPISALDLSNLPKLTGVTIGYCNMKSLNVSNCPVLDWLWIADEKKMTTLNISNSTLLKATMTKKYRVQRGSGTDHYFRKGVAEVMIRSKVKIVTKASAATTAAPAVPASFAEVAGKVPATVAVDPTSTAKNTKATALAAPGSAMQLNLGGATGKKFKSSKKKVATVNKNGVVTFKKGGKVKITYKVGKQTRKVTLTVIDPTMPKAVALNQTGTVAAKVGDAVTLTATMNEGAVSAIKWKTSNKKVATVKNGVVTFKKAGKVTITAVTKRGKKKAKVTYTVAKQ